MTASCNPVETATSLDSRGSGRRTAIIACCLLLGAGCSTASLEEPPPTAVPTAVPTATAPARTSSAAEGPWAVLGGAERAAWSRHLRAGRQHLALKKYALGISVKLLSSVRLH